MGYLNNVLVMVHLIKKLCTFENYFSKRMLSYTVHYFIDATAIAPTVASLTKFSGKQ